MSRRAIFSCVLVFVVFWYGGDPTCGWIVVSAGGRLTITASPPGWTLRSVAEREQFGCDQG